MQILRIILLVLAGLYIFVALQYQKNTAILQPQTQTASGIVSKIEKTDRVHSSFIFHIQAADFYLSWYYPPHLRVGQNWQLVLKLKPPHGLYNPQGFDFETWLKSNHIAATGFVVKSRQNKLIGEVQLNFIDQWRRDFGFFIQKNISTATRLLLAISVGDRELMQESDWQVLQATGTNHLFAIAGLHMGVLAFLIFQLFNFIFKCAPQLGLYFPRKNLCLLGVAVVLIPYALLSGFALPAERALFMVLFVIVLLLASRPLYAWHQFALILLLILICDPGLLYGMSLYLSFFAIVLILAALHGEVSSSSKWRDLFKIQLALYLGLISINFWFFGNASLIAPLANALAIPWVTFLVVPSCLMASLLFVISKTLCLWLLKFAALMLNLIWQFLVYCASLPLSQEHYLFYNAELMILVTLLLLVFILVPLISWRILAASAIIALFFYQPPQPKYGEIWFTVLDMGQGLATVLVTQNHTLIYDAGLPVAADYLRQLQRNNVDIMVISHGDRDHRAGADVLLKQLNIREILTSAPQFFPPALTQSCKIGQSWAWDGVQFSVLGPSPDQPAADNNASCVLRVSNGAGAILLPGDIEAQEEGWLLQHEPGELAANLIVAPHHGSSTSSSWPFLTAVAPKAVIFSTGYYNRYHFPAISVVKRYTDLGAMCYNTALNGAISVKLDRAGGMSVETARETSIT